jgi:hypothetical protein
VTEKRKLKYDIRNLEVLSQWHGIAAGGDVLVEYDMVTSTYSYKNIDGESITREQAVELMEGMRLRAMANTD